MNLQHLEYLIEIENCGSISKAARRLFVTQPYLSRILKEVESEYGITVFTREKTGITPTDSGRLFLDMARDLLDDAGNFQRIFRERADHYRLRVSACTCSHPNDAFIRMVKSIPDIPLRFSYRESSPRIVIGDVYSNRADVGVLMYLAHTRSQIEELLSFRHLEEHFLFSSRAQLFCREDHPILKEKDSLTMEKICQYNFALYPVEAGNARALESVYNNMDLNFINWNQIRQIVYVESRSASIRCSCAPTISASGSCRSWTRRKIIISYPFRCRTASCPQKKGVPIISAAISSPKERSFPRLPGHTLPFWNSAMARILIISDRCLRPKKAWKKSGGWRKRIKPQGCRKKAGSQLPFCGSPFGSLFYSILFTSSVSSAPIFSDLASASSMEVPFTP